MRTEVLKEERGIDENKQAIRQSRVRHAVTMLAGGSDDRGRKPIKEASVRTQQSFGLLARVHARTASLLTLAVS
ncbi:hypothetical protein [Paraburkholderia fynbosensis]|uniref:hypothetical protein n=1 Tax=Paraburkholderia fynbosensis TaxID=1200993 RepID=UPI001583FDFC|nr:hypothetical protein [Paraburkholderia fynbosensis]